MGMAKEKIYSRRDDVESVIYTLSYLIKGRLPWDPEYFEMEEEKGQPERGKDSEVDHILEFKRSMDDEKVRESLPVDLQILFTYARKLKYEQEPDYNFLIDTLLHLRNKSLLSEGYKIEQENVSYGPQEFKRNSVVANVFGQGINYKSIMSAIKISGMPSQGVNTITLQQNKTLNGSRYSV